MNKVLITGANGFIGANLCRYFLDKGWHVDAIVSYTSVNSWRLKDVTGHENITLWGVNLTGRNEITDLFIATDPEVIINCAAYGGYSNQDSITKIYSINQKAIMNMLEDFKENKSLKAFIQLGTSSEYGLNSAGPDETSHTVPNSHYAISKLAATSLCQYYGKVHNVPTCVLRLGSVYGPFEDPGRLVMKALLEAKQGRLIDIADPEITRDFIYIDDVCAAIEKAIEFVRFECVSQGEVFNISSGDSLSIAEIADHVACEYRLVDDLDETQFSVNASLLKQWDHKGDWYMQVSKASQKLNWESTISIESGIFKTRQWIEANPEIIKNMRSVYE